jgi:antitoxin PrlF
MPRQTKESAVYSRVSVKSQTVLPRAVREALAIKPGDTVRYRFTENGVILEKSPADRDDPFVSFTEWGGEHDDRAYGDL